MKVINWELCKKLKFDLTTRWYTHLVESILENETHKIHRDFEMQKDHLIPARRPNFVIINKRENEKKKKKMCRIVGLAARPTRKWKTNKTKREIITSTLLEN